MMSLMYELSRVLVGIVDIDTGGQFAVEEIRVGKADFRRAVILGEGEIGAQILAGAEQVVFADAEIGQYAVGC